MQTKPVNLTEDQTALLIGIVEAEIEQYLDAQEADEHTMRLESLLRTLLRHKQEF